MKASIVFIITFGTFLLGGCATHRESSSPGGDSRVADQTARSNGYDDRLIAGIRRGQTTAAQLLDWFGPADSRNLNPDGRAYLVWNFAPLPDGGSGHSGGLSVSLAPDGKVESYAARRGPAVEHRTVEFIERTESDMRQHMAQWAREGWSVSSVSARLPQADGTVHRKAELSRTEFGTASGVAYDDRRIAGIQRGQTTETQLLQDFGPPDHRDAKSDGRTQLAWTLGSRADRGATPSGVLSVSLAPDDTVDAYSARRDSL